MQKSVVIIGGCGHVGIPLGLALARADHKVTLLDINEVSVRLINDGKVPFLEEGAEPILKAHLGKNLFATMDSDSVKDAEVVIFVTGTPVDEHHNPRVHDVVKVIDSYSKFLKPQQLIVLRSTLYPGVVDLVEEKLKNLLGNCKISFCPERIVQGKGIEEIDKLPQIISGNSPEAEKEAAELFLTIAPKVIPLKIKEAELAKLITNSWRYLEFAIANQFYMMAESQGFDFYKIYSALKEDYPRAKHYVRPGLAAGPCLFKDTMQLSAFHKNNFFLGHSAMLINEGLPEFLADQMQNKLGGTLKNKKVAILGMTFKANNDDTRESLAFKLKKVLEIRMAKVIPSDVYLKETTPLGKALEEADGVVLGVPHNEYLNLKLNKPFVDCWGIWREAKI
jgi:UDP-N-acetyl-D-mannosaminuronic acid dehydrogenase